MKELTEVTHSLHHPRYAIDSFAVRDFPQKRILIAIADYDEVSWGIESPTPGIIFTHHFTDNLQGDYTEAFLFTFFQVVGGFGAFTKNILVKILNMNVFEEVAFIFAGSLGFFLAGIQLGIIAAEYSIICKYIYEANVYVGYRFAYPYTLYGFFFGLYGSSHPWIYNPTLAKEVKL